MQAQHHPLSFASLLLAGKIPGRLVSLILHRYELIVGLTLHMQADILRQKYPSYWLPFLRAPYQLIYALGPFFGVPRDLVKCARTCRMSCLEFTLFKGAVPHCGE